MATKLKQMRLAKGLTQSKLADLADINIRILQHYEQGSKNFDHARIDTIFKVAIALECSLKDIIEDNNFLNLIETYEKSCS